MRNEDAKTTNDGSLKHELEVATGLARRAGAMLLAEFHRPDGPRGEGEHHADVDDEVEDLLREELGLAFPGDGYRGEESGPRGLNRASTTGRTWIVDPNDGTKAFLRGHRGSAVSIALVEGGRPVLGVVFSPNAPDDRGDLFTWAEGEPLRRNGEVVAREPLPSDLGPNEVVLASSSADRHAEANARALAPARFRAMPSIAYRLALVAAGDADATFSINDVSDWDVAGGHALIRAVEGVLLADDGCEVSYEPGAREKSNVFAGHRRAALWLAGRNLVSLLEEAKRASRESGAASRSRGESRAAGLVAPYHPERSGLVRDPGVLSRAHGALLGQVIGDALGQMVEFRGERSVRAEYPDGVRDMRDGGAHETIAGQPTDDSELALALARTILRARGFDREAALAAYRDWSDSDPFDIGHATSSALGGSPLRDSKANGSLMRVSPLAIHGWKRHRGDLVRDARADSSITHPNPTCGDAVAAFCVAIAHAIRTGEGPVGVYRTTADWVRVQDSFCEEVAEVFADDTVEAPERLDGDRPGFVVLALRNAFHQMLHAPNFEEGLVATVSRGGDADTNGAIAGALLGAVHGRDAIPVRWRRTVLSCRPLPGAEHARAAIYWPVDVLQLAEGLVATGS